MCIYIYNTMLAFVNTFIDKFNVMNDLVKFLQEPEAVVHSISFE